MSIANEPAFPTSKDSVYLGLTKQEYFAGQALAGALASDGSEHEWATPKHAADRAVKCADALIAELEKGAE